MILLALAIYGLLGVVMMLEVRHAIPDARWVNVILAGVLWPLALYGWLSEVIKDWHKQWKENGKHW